MKARGENLTRRDWLAKVGGATVGAGALGLLGSCARLGEERRARAARPNVVFILTDDQSYDTLGCTGNAFMKTPNTDRLAREGALFTNAFATVALCSPSRASFITGLYPHTNGITTLASSLDENIPIFPALLRTAGYETAHIGKWHLRNDEIYQPRYDYWAVQEDQGEYFNPTKNINGKNVAFEGYDTDIVTQQAVEFIQKERDNKPFCLWVAYKSAHAPFTPAPRHSHLFEDVQFRFADSYFREDPGKPRRVRERHGRMHGERDYPGVLTLEEYAEMERNYYRTLMAAEEGVGSILAALEKTGLLDQTIIVYASDQGFIHSEHGIMLDKVDLYEGSIRLPMLVRYPAKIKAGQTIQQMVLNIDLAPTLLDFCGVPVPASMQGRSWRPLVSGRPATAWRDACLLEFFSVMDTRSADRPAIKGVRTDRFKLIMNLDPPDIDELYDLKADPLELNNLAQDPSYQQQVRELKLRLVALMKEYNDPAVGIVEARL